MATNTEIAAILSQSQQNLYVTGAPTLALGNNLLQTTAGTGAIDLSLLGGFGTSYRSATISFSTFASGQVTFEGSNNNVDFFAIYGTDTGFEWTNLVYASFTNPNTAKSFTIPLKFRYIRARVSVALSAAVTASIVYSTAPYVQPLIGQFPSANFMIISSMAGLSGNIAVVSAPTAPFRNYFCGLSYADGGAGGNIADVWFLDSASGPGGNLFAAYSRSTSTVESLSFTPSSPMAGTVGNPIFHYLNNGTVNSWGSIKYFVAP
jgi:hypothetical protein